MIIYIIETIIFNWYMQSKILKKKIIRFATFLVYVWATHKTVNIIVILGTSAKCDIDFELARSKHTLRKQGLVQFGLYPSPGNILHRLSPNIYLYNEWNPQPNQGLPLESYFSYIIVLLNKLNKLFSLSSF